MLNQLIESKNHQQENARRGGFIVTTLGVLVAVLMSGWTYSLFAKNYGMGAGELDLSSIVTPVPTLDEAPAPKPAPKIERAPSSRPNERVILKELYDSVEGSKEPPKDTSGRKDVVSATRFNLNDVDLGDRNYVPESTGRTVTGGTGFCRDCAGGGGGGGSTEGKEESVPVVVKAAPKTAETPKKTPPQVSLGVINGKALSLVKPAYPAAARAVRAAGAVNVQVTVDEQGGVISAAAVTGHPLLRAAAVQAARQSRFTPTLLSNQPVKVTGIIVYNFTLP